MLPISGGRVALSREEQERRTLALIEHDVRAFAAQAGPEGSAILAGFFALSEEMRGRAVTANLARRGDGFKLIRAALEAPEPERPEPGTIVEVSPSLRRTLGM